MIEWNSISDRIIVVRFKRKAKPGDKNSFYVRFCRMLIKVKKLVIVIIMGDMIVYVGSENAD